MTATGPQDRSPYVGLRSYRRAESELFHGRDREAREIATLWQAAGLTVVYGASGVGKTSLLHAGVLPRIDRERADVLPIARIAPRMPLAGVRGNPYVVALLSCWAPDRDPHELSELTVAEFLRTRPERSDAYGDPLPILAAVDQAEEIFHGDPVGEKDRAAFLGQLAQAVHEQTGLHLLLALREEYLFLVLPHERPLGQGSRARFHLRPLSREAALEAVAGPLEHTSRTMTREAAERLVDDLRTVVITDEAGNESTLELDTVEPVQLQVVCSALWESLPADVLEITEAHARMYANVEEFLFDFCRTAVAEVAAHFEMSPSEILFWLRNTFITEHGTRNTAYEGLQQTRGMPNGVARALRERRVLRAEHRLGIQWYELAHDKLIGPVTRAESPEVYLRSAREALLKRNWDAAHRLAEQAVRASELGEVWVRAEAAEVFATVAAANGEIETARRHCEEAVEIYAGRQRFDGVARVLTADARLWMAQGDNTKAIERIKAALSWAPNDLAAQMTLAEALLRAGMPRASAAVVNGVLDLLPTHLLQQARELLRLSA
ncbi:tetratricopeptide repeat protein [Spongiactinospora sp. TRM90649]|uniref:tetratricopeptide repeat protein n=1 Tax=Spongiactinospora sp. TRM90649 TaxID=3031114 RepID=UPI0023F7D9D6|nr:tetratricopeptide repeat protein [Spongiactinospora sp. TRM90649]MDF5752620.1 tetratricopeptide repeat protein [Spongiactinospora sp. TRM90649]